MSETRAQDGQTLGSYFEDLLDRSPAFVAAYLAARKRREREVARYRRRAEMAKTIPLPFKHRNRGWRRR